MIPFVTKISTYQREVRGTIDENYGAKEETDTETR